MKRAGRIAAGRPAKPGAPQSSATPSAPDLRARLLSLAALAAATLAAFAGVLRNGWILTDDPGYIYENPHVLGGWSHAAVREAVHSTQGGNWHPLTTVAHLAIVSAFGPAPVAHHAVSLALHALNAALAALALFAFTRRWWPGLFAAAFFALHPLRVESVAWAAELKDVLSGAGFLLTLLAYRFWVGRPGVARYALVCAALALALLAKPMAVSLPFVMLLLDAWPLGRLHGKVTARVIEKLPLFALAAGDAWMTAMAQREAGAMVTLGAHGMTPRLANAAVTVWRYLAETFWPRGLAIFHPNLPVAPLAAGLAGAGVAAVTAAALALARARPWLATGWLWYLVTLVPVLGIVQVGAQGYADRYTYLPAIGVALALVWEVASWVERRPAWRPVALATALVALAALGALTARQVALWKDTRTLYAHALAVTPDNAVSESTYGTALLLAGETPAAIPHYEAALRMVPGFPYAEAGLGRALLVTGHAADAAPHLERALAGNDNADAHDYLGSGDLALGRFDDAAREFTAALRLEPEHDRALVHLGQALGAMGRYSDAEAPLARAVAHAPADLERRRLLAMALLFGGRESAALEEYARILAAQPDDLDALTRVAWTRATSRDDALRNGEEAVRLAERARRVAAGPQATIERTAAAAYAAAGRFADAKRAATLAASLAMRAGDAATARLCAGELREYRAGRALRAAP